MNIVANGLKHLAGALLRGYQLLVSPFLPGTCRFHPTCSEYSRQAVYRHGVLKGGWLAVKRICRCHPWGGWGEDPVPGSTTESTTGPATRHVRCPDTGNHAPRA